MTESPATPGPMVIAVSLSGFIAVWAVAAAIAQDSAILPSPAAVWSVTVHEARSGALGHHMGATFLRVAAAFVLAFFIGTALGLAMGLSRAANRWLGVWVVLLQNMPALVVIVLCYLWIGLNEAAAITAVALNKTAMVAVTMREGVLALDPRVADMARVYRMSPLARLRHEIWPQLWPFAAASIRNGLAIIWKIVLVVEFLGRGDGVGFQIHLYFQLFEITYVLAYALSFVSVMLVIEYAVIAVIERRSTRWRRASESGPARP